MLFTGDLLPNISLVVGQSIVNISRARLTANQLKIGQQITVSKNLLSLFILYLVINQIVGACVHRNSVMTDIFHGASSHMRHKESNI